VFGYLRHGLVGRGVQMVMSLCSVALSVRLIQLILAFRGE
jgi:hypothetical protein